MRHRVEIILARVIDDPVERPAALDPERFVDLTEREIMAAAGLVASWIDEPGFRAHAFQQSCRLPGSRRHCRPHVSPEHRAPAAHLDTIAGGAPTAAARAIKMPRRAAIQREPRSSVRARSENAGTTTTRAAARQSRALESGPCRARRV